MSCGGLRIGGTLSATGITGGVDIHSTAIAVLGWDGFYVKTGSRRAILPVAGRAGGYAANTGLPSDKLRILNLRIYDTVGGAIIPGGLDDNTDLLLSELNARDGFYLERDMPDGTQRYIYAYARDQAGLLAGQWRSAAVPLSCPWPYWRQSDQDFQIIGGGDILTVDGDVPIYDPVLEFSGDGTFTHSDLGWSITITGSSGTVIVDLGDRTVLQAGVNVDNLMTRTLREWGYLTSGAQNVTADVSVTVRWRNQWDG